MVASAFAQQKPNIDLPPAEIMIIPPLKSDAVAPVVEAAAPPAANPSATPTSTEPRMIEMLSWREPHGGYMTRMRQRIIEADKKGDLELRDKLLSIYEITAKKHKLDIIEPEVDSTRYKISKDTLMSRIAAAGKLAEAEAIYASKTAVEKFAWDGYSWFWSDNPILTDYAKILKIEPSVLLARDSNI